MAEQGYNKALARVKERQQSEARLAEWLRENQRRINELWRRAERIDVSVPFHKGIDCSPGYQHTVYISISLRALQGLKDPALEVALTPWLDADESRCQDFAQYLNRDYHFTYKLPGGEVRVQVNAYVADENPTCRKILVERRVQPRVEEIYKLACDGDIVEADPVLPKVGNDPLTIDMENPQ